jgi:hypothetical protein
MTTQKEENVLYGHYAMGSLESNRMCRRRFAIENADVLCNTLIYDLDNYKTPVDDYVMELCSTSTQEICIPPPPPVAELYGKTYTIVPRGAATLAFLAHKEKIDPIKKLFSAGATPCKEYTIWYYGEDTWLWLSEVLKEYHSRKMAKPAFSVHN